MNTDGSEDGPLRLVTAGGQSALMLSIGHDQNAMTLARPAVTAVPRKLGAAE